MRVGLYIYDEDGVVHRISTFDDEKISITSSIQNVNDISKVFTDYSQSFTIPADTNNNSIFKHWHENAVENGFNQMQRYDGYITIGTEIFRTGKFQLESSSIKGNLVNNYKLTFYGVLKSLSDKFGEDLLKDIEELNDYTFQYTGNNVITRATSSTAYDVSYPLISSSRVWTYGDATSTDISTSAGAIYYNELFPALRVSKIFEAIENKYGITFTGNFLNQTRFTDAFLWMKNKDAALLQSEEVTANITSTSGSTVNFTMSTANDTVTYLANNYGMGDALLMNATFSSSCDYWINVYKDGNLYTQFTGTGTTFNNTIFYNGSANDVGTYSFTIQANQEVTVSGTIRGENPYLETYIEGTYSATITSYLDLTAYAPEIKVADFFSGILKMFNLTAFSYDENIYTVNQLDAWYYEGETKDFTKYTTTDVDFERLKNYKKIEFKYQKSEGLMNKGFSDAFGREYGDLMAEFNNDGQDYTIQLPFENMLFNKFSGTDLKVGYSLKTDYQPYIPKPVILYYYGYESLSSSEDFYMHNGSTASLKTRYKVFGQDVAYQGYAHSLNFGNEYSDYLGYVVNKSLYSDYYSDYLYNLFNIKSRMAKVTMKLSYPELISLKLNDRIIIRDKRYIINQFTTDMDTFESKFELIQDFRDDAYNNSAFRLTDFKSKTLTFDYIGDVEFEIDTDADGMIDTISSLNGVLTVDIFENTSGVSRVATLGIKFQDDQITIKQEA